MPAPIMSALCVAVMFLPIILGLLPILKERWTIGLTGMMGGVAAVFAVHTWAAQEFPAWYDADTGWMVAVLIIGGALNFLAAIGTAMAVFD